MFKSRFALLFSSSGTELFVTLQTDLNALFVLRLYPGFYWSLLIAVLIGVRRWDGTPGDQRGVCGRV
jgi:hypothetical protein